MFKNALFVAFLAISSYAVSIGEMVNSALDNNYDLKSLQSSIDVASKQIEVSTNWKNPTLTLGANDIQFDDISKRDLEPMQAQYLGFSQVIPLGDKLKIQEKIAKKDETIAKLLFEDKKLQLKSKIYEYSYTILVLEKKQSLLEEIQQNIKSLQSLSKALYENGKMTQSDLINAKIAYSNVEIKKENLDTLIKTLYLKLQEITYTDVNKIEASLEIKDIKLETEIDTHPKVLMTYEKSQKLLSLSDLEIARKTSDIKLNLAYFQRDDKYKDYANISVNIPLSLYGTENTKALKAKIKAKELKSRLIDIKKKFHTKLSVLQTNIDSSVVTYRLLNKEIIPLKRAAQENIEAYNSFDQIKPQATINSLNEVISYEMMELDQIKKYFTSISKAIYYTQGLK